MAESVDLPGLVRRVASGDSAAEHALVEHFAPRVRALTLARTRDPDLARDLTQDSLIALLVAARRGQIRDLDRVAAFASGVARNIINNHHRRTVKLQEAPLEDELEQAGVPALVARTDDEEIDRQRVMARALSTLGAADREVLLLTLIDGLKPGEIAARTGLAPDVVRTRKSRALKRVLGAIGSQSQNPAVRHI